MTVFLRQRLSWGLRGWGNQVWFLHESVAVGLLGSDDMFPATISRARWCQGL